MQFTIAKQRVIQQGHAGIMVTVGFILLFAAMVCAVDFVYKFQQAKMARTTVEIAYRSHHAGCGTATRASALT